MDSGVPDQPFGDLQTLTGCVSVPGLVDCCLCCVLHSRDAMTVYVAIGELDCRATNRAKRLTETHSGLCIAIEGGVGDCIGSSALECFAWAVVIDPSTGRKGQARSASFQLPDAVATLVRGGVELGSADDQVLGRTDSGHGSGTVGCDNIIIITEHETAS